jgi:hypothetical protein
MTWALRGVFAAIVIAVMATQAARIGRADAKPEENAGLDRRLTALGSPATAVKQDGVLLAWFPGCRQAVAIASLDADGSNGEAIRALMSTEVSPRYVYLGSVSDRLDPVVVGFRWALASTLAAFGLYPDHVRRDAVVVLVPKACHDTVDLDWSVLSPWPAP